jgi:prepilin signal peptidase PulO-like enzyme (type II secretory pathway)
MVWVILFVFGLVFGSFLNVVALRYDGEHFLFDPAIIGGRSHCPKCNKVLRWFELIPVASFFLQKAKCRACKTSIGIQYPIVELLVGCIFVAVPWRIEGAFIASPVPLLIVSLLWIIVFFVLALISYIDIRLGIIPDECHVLLGILGILLTLFYLLYGGGANPSFFGAYAALFGFQQSILVARLVGVAFGFLFFEALVLITRGRGMGMGDVKFALPLGLLFGWPDILFATVAAFIFGAIAGTTGILVKKKTLQGTLPFGPFLAAGATFVFFFGFGFLQWYLKLLGI